MGPHMAAVWPRTSGKTTTAVNYIIEFIDNNPSAQVFLISPTETMGRQLIANIKTRLFVMGKSTEIRVPAPHRIEFNNRSVVSIVKDEVTIATIQPNNKTLVVCDEYEFLNEFMIQGVLTLMLKCADTQMLMMTSPINNVITKIVENFSYQVPVGRWNRFKHWLYQQKYRRRGYAIFNIVPSFLQNIFPVKYNPDIKFKIDRQKENEILTKTSEAYRESNAPGFGNTTQKTVRTF